MNALMQTQCYSLLWSTVLLWVKHDRLHEVAMWNTDRVETKIRKFPKHEIHKRAKLYLCFYILMTKERRNSISFGRTNRGQIIGNY